jgi:hypothetical protein
MKLAVFILLECHAQTTRIAGARRQSIVRRQGIIVLAPVFHLAIPRWSKLHGVWFAWSLVLRSLIVFLSPDHRKGQDSTRPLACALTEKR